MSSVCIAGNEWLPRDKGKHGDFEIHRKGTSIFVRLVGITQKLNPNAMEVDGGDPDIDYPPTFNLQNEVVQFKYSDAEDSPWYLFMDLVISRSSRDVARFRKGKVTGTIKFTCIVGTMWASKAQKRKAVVFVGACLALTASLSLKKGLAQDAYNEALQAPRKNTTPLVFEITPPIGPTEFLRLSKDQLDLKEGSSIQDEMMDLALRSLLVRTGPHASTTMIHRYIENSAPSRQDRDGTSSAGYNTPQHYNFFPIGTGNLWALLVISQDRESESGGYDNEAFLISTSPDLDATQRSIAAGILQHYPLHFPSPSPSAQAPHSMFHPTIVALPHQSHCEAWQSGDRIINYFIQILQSVVQFRETFRSPTQGLEQLRLWDEKGIDPVRPMIATAVMYHLL